MKNLTILFSLIVFSISTIWAQPMLWSADIEISNRYVRDSTEVLEMLPVDLPSDGKVLVTFDGTILMSPDDRMIVAASDNGDWLANDGHVSMEVPNTDQNRRSFKHVRSYDVTAGMDTFYAVARNYVETGGTGQASFYGHLVVEFYPNDGDIVMESAGVSAPNVDLTSGVVSLDSISITTTMPGTVLVNFSGYGTSDVGDRIIVAASDNGNWNSNDGNVNFEAFDTDVNRNPFAHVRSYSVAAGTHTFYGVAENYVETDGSGIASIYANLSVIFYPDGDTMGHSKATPITVSSEDMETAVYTLGMIADSFAKDGFVIVNVSGSCTSDEGDRIILAASDMEDWTSNSGATSVEAIDSDIDRNSFSHTMMYPVTAGADTFYAVGHNYVETDGSGIASVYGALSLQYFPEPDTVQVGVADIDAAVPVELWAYPNPVSQDLQLNITNNAGAVELQVLTLQGQLLETIEVPVGVNAASLNFSGKSSGIYFVKAIMDNGGVTTIRVIKQ